MTERRPPIRRFRLNPTDCLFHAFDYLMRRQGYAGTGTFMVLELRGPLDSAEIVEAAKGAMAAHPVTMAAAGVSFWRARPRWVFAGEPVGPAYTSEDLSGEPEWERVFQERSSTQLSQGWDVRVPPQIHLDHFRGPADQHRLLFRWPHALMDAEGAQYFLGEVQRCGQLVPGKPSDALLPDDTRLDPVGELGLRERLRLMWRGITDRSPAESRTSPAADDRSPPRPAGFAWPLHSLPDRPAESRRLCFLVRRWLADAAAELRAKARALTPPGPALYGRYLAACTLRAVARIHAEYDRPLDYCGLMFPMRLPGLTRRPLRGNYLVAGSLSARPGLLDNRRALAEDIAKQVHHYLDRDGPLASWALQRLMAGLRLSQYRRVVRWETERQPFATGFSYYGEIEPPLRRFLGTEVENLYGGGVVSIPPAWNVTFSRFGQAMNMVVAWPSAVFPPAVVERYAALIAEELFA